MADTPRSLDLHQLPCKLWRRHQDLEHTCNSLVARYAHQLEVQVVYSHTKTGGSVTFSGSFPSLWHIWAVLTAFRIDYAASLGNTRSLDSCSRHGSVNGHALVPHSDSALDHLCLDKQCVVLCASMKSSLCTALLPGQRGGGMNMHLESSLGIH